MAAFNQSWMFLDICKDGCKFARDPGPIGIPVGYESGRHSMLFRILMCEMGIIFSFIVKFENRNYIKTINGKEIFILTDILTRQ